MRIVNQQRLVGLVLLVLARENTTNQVFDLERDLSRLEKDFGTTAGMSIEDRDVLRIVGSRLCSQSEVSSVACSWSRREGKWSVLEAGALCQRPGRSCTRSLL